MEVDKPSLGEHIIEAVGSLPSYGDFMSVADIVAFRSSQYPGETRPPMGATVARLYPPMGECKLAGVRGSRPEEGLKRGAVKVKKSTVPPLPGIKWRRAMFAEADTVILAESPEQVYSGAVIDGGTWTAQGRIELERLDGYVFEVFGAKFLDHHAPSLKLLRETPSRSRRLDWAASVVLCAEVLEVPEVQVTDPVQQGQMVWLLMDDLCAQDKIDLWDSIFAAARLEGE